MIKCHRPDTDESRIFVVSSKISDRRNQNVSSACYWSNRRETAGCHRYRRILVHTDRMKRSRQKSTARILREKVGPRDDSFLWNNRVSKSTTVGEFGRLMILKINTPLQASVEKWMIILRDAATSRYHPYHQDYLSHPHPQHTQSLVVSIEQYLIYWKTCSKSNRELNC